MRLVVDGVWMGFAVDATTGYVPTTADVGRHDLRRVGFDAGGAQLDEHELKVRAVAPTDVWVGITSPSDGAEVTDPADVRPGDIVRFWRYNGSGHNAVLVDWLKDDRGDIVGLTYWSTPSSPDGIGYHAEHFGTGGSDIDPAYFFRGRVRDPADWELW